MRRKSSPRPPGPPSRLPLPPPGAPPVEAVTVPGDLLSREWQRLAPEWSRVWSVPDLRELVRVEKSHRMRTSLGSFWPDDWLIRIADVLLEAPPEVFYEVLCHEAAHAAVQHLFGKQAPAHGEEWQALMRFAGLEPRVYIPMEVLGRAAQRAARKRWVWEHVCPHCRARRVARRPVYQWRCRACAAEGGDGMLRIKRRRAPSD